MKRSISRFVSSWQKPEFYSSKWGLAGLATTARGPGGLFSIWRCSYGRSRPEGVVQWRSAPGETGSQRFIRWRECRTCAGRLQKGFFHLPDMLGLSIILCYCARFWHRQYRLQISTSSCADCDTRHYPRGHTPPAGTPTEFAKSLARTVDAAGGDSRAFRS
jgi:hypothetical protein